MSKIITRKQWIAALKSGEYKQGKSALIANTNEFCCLGVACVVAGIDEGEIRRGSTSIDLSRLYGALALPGQLHLDNLGAFSAFYPPRVLSNLNDIGYTFEQIADLLIFDTWMNGWEQEDDQ